MIFIQPKEHRLVLDFHPQSTDIGFEKVHRLLMMTRVNERSHPTEAQGKTERRHCYTVSVASIHLQSRFSTGHSCGTLTLSKYFPCGWARLKGPHQIPTPPPPRALIILHLYDNQHLGRLSFKGVLALLELHLTKDLIKSKMQLGIVPNDFQKRGQQQINP